jgi:hypothetical protein
MAMTPARVVALRLVGVASLVMAGFGVFYTLSYLAVLYSASPTQDEPYFREAYYTMVSICFIWYVLLVFFGVQFWRLRTESRFWFLGLLIAEIAYFLSIGRLWRLENQDIAMSIGAATGVANGGLVAQAITLFPIWAPVIVFWAHSNNALNADAQKPRAG